MASEKANPPPPAYDQVDHTVSSAYPHPQTSTTVIVTGPSVGPDPTTIVCPSCRATVVTRLDYETTTRTHLCAALLCLFICWPCVCVPYLTTTCRDANHYCPNCSAFIGTYRK
ncbi:lipopolysaccharide-induced tumor necrosis factor-alpha factor-like [Toxorhynchites rutilus septentrionalis]|uniref:lipopolysaccharide-induced tumor necrosis factor-alpha factor-like n=1 Tax=Toxorhynchites rutilus septentrionalis TaxID=329112 RepID=UPI00247A8B38|nr:lipopolysaccharide-induced tumor necrosis factor-alpha factor-like [Toxorhynchites rutilus septentrionalis]